MKKSSSKNKGFTLFELLAVLAILSIIAAIAVPRVMQTIKNARIEALKSNMQLIANSMQRYVTEKELTSCVGGMFVIHPTDAEVNEESSGMFKFDSNGNPDTPDSDSIYNIQLDRLATTANERATEISKDYIEGGIPAHIRVIVHTDGTKGIVTVSYGDVDSTPESKNDGADPLRINGITPDELKDGSGNSYTITKTFELESGEGHDHTSPQ